jgi:hypothetical protein
MFFLLKKNKMFVFPYVYTRTVYDDFYTKKDVTAIPEPHLELNPNFDQQDCRHRYYTVYLDLKFEDEKK